ncbi:MAG: hypothetical protein ACRC1Z_14385 [Waterburya sp.]
MKYTRLLGMFFLLTLAFWLGLTTLSEAAMCRHDHGQEVCILKLKRSAKNYWEYRAKVSFDGKEQNNLEVYNCRDRTIIRKGKYPIPFKPDSLGESICKIFLTK